MAQELTVARGAGEARADVWRVMWMRADVRHANLWCDLAGNRCRLGVDGPPPGPPPNGPPPRADGPREDVPVRACVRDVWVRVMDDDAWQWAHDGCARQCVCDVRCVCGELGDVCLRLADCE